MCFCLLYFKFHTRLCDTRLREAAMSAKTETPGTSTIAAGTRRRAPLVQEGNRTAYHTIHATGALQVLLSVFPRSFCQF